MAKPKDKIQASRSDYIRLVEDFFGTMHKDIFSNDLSYFNQQDSLWVPVLNKLKVVRSHIKEEAKRLSHLQFNAQDIEDHLYYLEDSKDPTFVIDVPKWDGRDRIKELAQRIILADSQVEIGIDEGVFEELLKYWHSKLWLRLENPEIRNEIFILAGTQNLGKDFWIRENLDALGQFLVNFSIHSNERDTKEQLHRGLVMNISEFDRTSRSEVSLLKEIVTATQTDLRFAYDRRAQTRRCRCSFIASTNTSDIFNDPTGHSRYVFFDIKLIDKSSRFTNEDKLQVLAQGKHLAKQAYKPSQKSLDLMAEQIKELTPEDEYDLIIERWDYLCTERWHNLTEFDKEQFCKIKGDHNYSGFYPNNMVFEIITKLEREFGKTTKKIRGTLKRMARQRRDPILGRGYYFNLTIPTESKQNDFF